jgi:DNA-binding MarR family transcriptional regulator
MAPAMSSRVLHVAETTLEEAELDEAMELLHFAFRRVIEEPDSLLGDRGYGRLHHRLLYVIGKNRGLAVGELVELLGVTKQAVHVPLRDLVDVGLVEVQRARGDRRVKRLALTPAGRRYERRLSRAEHRVIAEAFQRAGPSAVEGWRRVMDALGQGRRLRSEQVPNAEGDSAT